ncbi:PREDICTED: protein S100-A9 [Hipposideros armiger]|uniref:Protein S100-A9 n=1 Tax=Hipposideros armiger TaxID=186990 RepID=A0A8B7Q260_HIPAR|nr:PREDICTED: protein S100-A9 [Hipposideros armiger]XP_019482835.1 PREDICTED: protein S100-A9 [Hipposideros armiger]
MSSLMECSFETIINIFHQYSVRLGHPDRLNQREFKQLVKKELPNFLKKQKRNEAAINKIMVELDTDGDKDLTFEEFAVLIGRLTAASHEEMHRTAPPGEGHSHGPGFGESTGTCQSQGGPGQTQDGHGHGHSHGGHGHSHNH